jgi:hypothetical protein
LAISLFFPVEREEVHERMGEVGRLAEALGPFDWAIFGAAVRPGRFADRALGAGAGLAPAPVGVDQVLFAPQGLRTFGQLHGIAIVAMFDGTLSAPAASTLVT